MTQGHYVRKKKKKGGLVFFLCLLLIAGILAGYWHFAGDELKYKQGLYLLESKQYSAALEIFEGLPDHPETADRIPEAKYGLATQQLQRHAYAEAAELFMALGDYKSSAQQARLCRYKQGIVARQDGDYETAREFFLLAGDYEDAPQQVQHMTYQLGHAAFLMGEYGAAEEHFSQLQGTITDYGYHHFRTLQEAAPFLEEQRLALNELVYFYIGEEVDEEFHDTLRNLFPSQYYSTTYYGSDSLLTLSAIHYYPGENILYAWRNNDTSKLTADELQVMELALQLVAQAKAESDSELETELWLHDWICSKATYDSPNMDVRRDEFIQLRELTCIGAMLDGYANCQGYTDAFYLLGNLAGLEVGRILGYTEAGHIWNTITLDGQRYIVDVTFDDLSDDELDGWSYTYFNTFWDPAVYDPMGDDQVVPEMITEEDLTKGYFHHTDRIFTTMEDAARSLARQCVNEGNDWTYVMVKDMVFDHDAMNAVLKPILKQYHRGFSWSLWADHYGGDTYVWVYWE